LQLRYFVHVFLTELYPQKAKKMGRTTETVHVSLLNLCCHSIVVIF